MASHNEITGDALVSKRNNDNYRNNYDLIFGKKKNAKQADQQAEETSVQDQESSLRSVREGGA